MVTRLAPTLSEERTAMIGWQARLNQASTHEAVVAVAREFLAVWSPCELAQLPEECRPGKLVDSQDIGEYALALVQRSCAGDRIGDVKLQRMAGFFTRASLRLAQITAQATAVLAEREG